jgi:thioredoxin 1
MTEVAYIQGDALDELVAQGGLIVVDFTATWCGPCRKIAPFIEQLAETYHDRAQVLKLDIDQNKPTAKKFEIKSIPAVLFFKGGEVVDRVVGFAAHERFVEILEQHL